MGGARLPWQLGAKELQENAMRQYRLLGQTGTHDLHPKLTILPDGSIVTKSEVASMLRQGYDLNDGPSSRV